jgi:single-stranded DNA-binding protein
MRGWDSWIGFGDVIGFNFGKTGNGDSACTISLAIKKRGGHIINARVNVYGDKVFDCRRNLRIGVSVTVKGELMNRHCRKVNDKVTEIRASEIEFCKQFKE